METSLNFYVNDFFNNWEEGKDFSLPEVKVLYLSDIKLFLNNYRLSSTFIGIEKSCSQLNSLIEKAEEIVDDLDENNTRLNNPIKVATYIKALKKSEKKEKEEVA